MYHYVNCLDFSEWHGKDSQGLFKKIEDVLEAVNLMVPAPLIQTPLKINLHPQLWLAKSILLNWRNYVIFEGDSVLIGSVSSLLQKLTSLQTVTKKPYALDLPFDEAALGCFREDIRDIDPSLLIDHLQIVPVTIFTDLCSDPTNHPLVEHFLLLLSQLNCHSASSKVPFFKPSLLPSTSFLPKTSAGSMLWYTLDHLTSLIPHTFLPLDTWKSYLPTTTNITNLLPNDMIKLDSSPLQDPSYPFFIMILRSYFTTCYGSLDVQRTPFQYFHRLYREVLISLRPSPHLFTKACQEHNSIMIYLMLGCIKKQMLSGTSGVAHLFIHPHDPSLVFRLATSIVKSKVGTLDDTIPWRVHWRGQHITKNVSALYFALRRKDRDGVDFLVHGGISLKVEDWMEELWGDAVEEGLEELKALQRKHFHFKDYIEKKDAISLRKCMQSGGGPFVLAGDSTLCASLELLYRNPACFRLLLEQHPTIQAILSSLSLLPKELILRIIQLCSFSFNEPFLNSFLCRCISQGDLEHLHVLLEYYTPSSNLLIIALRQNRWSKSIPAILRLNLKPLDKYRDFYLLLSGNLLGALLDHYPSAYLQFLEDLSVALEQERDHSRAQSLAPSRVLVRLLLLGFYPSHPALQLIFQRIPKQERNFPYLLSLVPISRKTKIHLEAALTHLLQTCKEN